MSDRKDQDTEPLTSEDVNEEEGIVFDAEDTQFKEKTFYKETTSSSVLDSVCLMLVLEFVDPLCLFSKIPLVCQDWYEYIADDNLPLWTSLYYNVFGDQLIEVRRVKDLFRKRLKSEFVFEKGLRNIGKLIMLNNQRRMSMINSNRKRSSIDDLFEDVMSNLPKTTNINTTIQNYMATNELVNGIITSVAMFSSNLFEKTPISAAISPFSRFIQSRSAFVVKKFTQSTVGYAEAQRKAHLEIVLFGVEGSPVHFDVSLNCGIVEEHYLDRLHLTISANSEHSILRKLLSVKYDGEFQETKNVHLDFQVLKDVQTELVGHAADALLFLRFLFSMLNGFLGHLVAGEYVPKSLMPQLKKMIKKSDLEPGVLSFVQDDIESDEDDDEDLDDFIVPDEEVEGTNTSVDDEDVFSHDHEDNEEDFDNEEDQHDETEDLQFVHGEESDEDESPEPKRRTNNKRKRITSDSEDEEEEEAEEQATNPIRKRRRTISSDDEEEEEEKDNKKSNTSKLQIDSQEYRRSTQDREQDAAYSKILDSILMADEETSSDEQRSPIQEDEESDEQDSPQLSLKEELEDQPSSGDEEEEVVKSGHAEQELQEIKNETLEAATPSPQDQQSSSLSGSSSASTADSDRSNSPDIDELKRQLAELQEKFRQRRQLREAKKRASLGVQEE